MKTTVYSCVPTSPLHPCQRMEGTLLSASRTFWPTVIIHSGAGGFAKDPERVTAADGVMQGALGRETNPQSSHLQTPERRAVKRTHSD